ASAKNAARSAPAIRTMISLPRPTARPSSESREGQQRDYPRALNRDRELALMPCAVARGSAGHDFAPFGDEVLERTHVLVIDLERLVGTESAHFTAPAAGSSAHASALAATSFTRAIGLAALAAGTRTASVLMTALSGALLDFLFVRHFVPVSLPNPASLKMLVECFALRVKISGCRLSPAPRRSSSPTLQRYQSPDDVSHG